MKKHRRARFVYGWKSLYTSVMESHNSGGIVLVVCAVIALIIANIPALSGVQDIWNTKMGIVIGDFSLKMSLLHWINDGLMAIFFLVVGLEIKREMMVGELSSVKKATLPFFAALGGMIVPALIYTLFNIGTPTENGWGIPMATDIAFAIGVLALLGKKCPLSLKIFLTALAIVDDLGAIVVLAIFYPSHAISLTFLMLAAAVFVLLLLFNKFRVKSLLAYIVPGIVLWYFVYMSGIHATIAGVLLAIAIPHQVSIKEVKFSTKMRNMLGEFHKVSGTGVTGLANLSQLGIIHNMGRKVAKITPMMHVVESGLHQWVRFLIMPLFALANAGVVFELDAISSIPPMMPGIFLGLLVGKPLGIFLFSWIVVKLKFAVMPENASWIQLFAIGVLGGIGFTMSIFINNLAFTDPAIISVGKVAILITSFVAAIVGAGVIVLTSKNK